MASDGIPIDDEYGPDAFEFFARRLNPRVESTKSHLRWPKLRTVIRHQDSECLVASMPALETEIEADHEKVTLTVCGESRTHYWRDFHLPGSSRPDIRALSRCKFQATTDQIQELSFGKDAGSLTLVRGPGWLIHLLFDSMAYCRAPNQPAGRRLREQGRS